MGRRSKKAIFNQKLFEHNFLIIAVAILGYGMVFLTNFDRKHCGTEWCDWDLGPLFYGIAIVSMIVFLLEVICYAKLIIQAPKKVNAKMLLLTHFIILLLLFAPYITTNGFNEMLMFLSLGFCLYDVIVFIITTVVLRYF